MPKTMYSSKEVAELMGVTQRRVNALAADRGVGTVVGNRRVFSKADIRALKPGPVGNPQFIQKRNNRR